MVINFCNCVALQHASNQYIVCSNKLTANDDCVEGVVNILVGVVAVPMTTGVMLSSMLKMRSSS